MEPHNPLRLLERDGAERKRSQSAIEERQRERQSGGRLRCADCGHVITHETERISIAGSHEHGKMNPGGFSFHIGCFRDAPGCARLGKATEEHTWFPGYAWCMAMCGRCGTHLGWAFNSRDGERFFGLILGRLKREN